MRRVSIFLSILLALVFGGVERAFAETPGLTVTMSATPAHVLPGEEPEIRFKFANRSTGPATVPGLAVFEITTPRDRFLAFWSQPDRLATPLPAIYESGGRRSLSKGESRSFDFPMSLGENLCSHLPAGNSLVGTYKLRVGFADWLNSNDLAGITSLADVSASGAPPLLLTNEVSFSVDAPINEESVVLQHIMAATNGAGPCAVGHGSAIARDIWEQYPRTRYGSWAVWAIEPRDPVERKQIYDRLKRVNPKHALVAEFELGAAEADAQAALDALHGHRDLQRALALASQARSGFRRVLENSDADVARLEATDALAKFPTDQQIRETHRKLVRWDSLAPAGSSAVIPFASCAKLGDDNVAIWLGYNNPNGSKVSLPVGPDNHFAPEPADRRQPTKFEAGQHPHDFKVRIGRNDRLTWVLNGTSLVLEAARLPACTDEGDD
jgi:hypothetical protein